MFLSCWFKVSLVRLVQIPSPGGVTRGVPRSSRSGTFSPSHARAAGWTFGSLGFGNVWGTQSRLGRRFLSTADWLQIAWVLGTSGFAVVG